MKNTELMRVLTNLGWSVSKDEAGDTSCIMTMSEITLRLLPSVRKRPDHFRVSWGASVSLIAFSEVVNEIYNGRNKHTPVIVKNSIPEKIKQLTTDDIIRLTNNEITWAKEQNIEAGLKNYRNFPTSSKGTRPIRHLAALALNGDVDKLSYYIDRFNNGVRLGLRLGFVPYIKLEMIDAALIIAKQKNKNA